uniref:ARAD1D34408p n=1 Tax=Blastobotrys adeninivorans TaxID=409370 RepID=A0A060TGX6_BLAAD
MAQVKNLGSAAKPKPSENWDDDFDDADFDPSVFQSSVSSVSSVGSNGFYGGAHSISDDDEGFDDTNLTTKLSKLHLKNSPHISTRQVPEEFEDGDSTLDGGFSTVTSGAFNGASAVANKTPKRIPSTIGDGTLRSSVDTLKVSKMRSGNLGVLDHDFFSPPDSLGPLAHQTSRQFTIPTAEPVDDDFVIEVDGDDQDLGDHLQQKLKNRSHFEVDEDSWGEESLGVRPDSRLSDFSSSSYSMDESESEAGEDFLTGLQVPDHNMSFAQILENKRRQALEIAEKEQEQLLQGRKYDTIRSNGSANSVPDNIEADEDMDFFDGIEVNDGRLAAPRDAHRNVVVKNSIRRGGGIPPSRSANSVQFASASAEHRYPRTAQSSANLRSHTVSRAPSVSQGMSTIRNKASMPVLKPDSSASFGGLASRSPPKRRPSGAISSSGAPGGTLRSVNSIATIPQNSNTSPRKKESRLKFSRAKTGRLYGDGTELDLLDDLPTSIEREKSYTVTPRTRAQATIVRRPLDTYREKGKTRQSHARNQPTFVKEKAVHVRRRNNNKTRRGPGLIQQLGPPVTALTGKGYNGDMRFNPRKLIWEGNDVELKKFDSINAKTPGLIAYISNKGVQVVGDMVFDPKLLRWINVNEDEEQNDPFQGLDDLEVGQPEQSALASLSASVASHGEMQVGDEFDIDEEFIYRLEHEDSRWNRKVNGWFSFDEHRDTSYLNEIRTMVMNNR